jgi:hypothetical protein
MWLTHCPSLRVTDQDSCWDSIDGLGWFSVSRERTGAFHGCPLCPMRAACPQRIACYFCQYSEMRSLGGFGDHRPQKSLLRADRTTL